MRMKWLPAGIGLFLIGMSVVSFAGERVYEQAEFPHEICETWTDIHGGRTLEITPRAVDGDILDGMYDVAGGGVKGAVKAVLLREGQPVTEQISWNVMSPNYKILVYEISRTTVLPAGILNLWTAYIWEWRWKRCASSTENRTARMGHFLT